MKCYAQEPKFVKLLVCNNYVLAHMNGTLQNIYWWLL
jgi:hypothetical protein